MAKKKAATGTKTYILTLKGGNVRKITIPDTWKLTFGNLVPYEVRGSGGAQVALRLYEGTKENLRAVFTDVIAIRDASIEIVEKRTTVQRKASQRHTGQGMKDVVVEARMTEWVDPDADEDTPVPEQFLRLETNKGDDF